MSWLNEHLETFVQPVIGHIPMKAAAPYFTQAEMSVIKSVWRSVKAAALGKKILLAGRDVFVFEILARRENYPTTFMAECSRVSVKEIKLTDSENLFLFDTGFMGSIPMALGIQSFKLLSYAVRNNQVQVFPHLTQSRGLALKIEKTPKYWDTAKIVDGEVVQHLAPSHEFTEAAKLTIEVYTSSAPRFVSKPKPVGGKYELLS